MYETRDLVLVLGICSREEPHEIQSTTEIGRRLHVSRLGTFMAATGDQAEAIALYRWNVELAGAFFETLTLTEVVLRNALDEQLTIWNAQQRDRSTGRRHPAEWTGDPATPLRTLTSHALRQARQAAVMARAGRPVDHPRKERPHHPRRPDCPTHLRGVR